MEWHSHVKIWTRGSLIWILMQSLNWMLILLIEAPDFHLKYKEKREQRQIRGKNSTDLNILRMFIVAHVSALCCSCFCSRLKSYENGLKRVMETVFFCQSPANFHQSDVFMKNSNNPRMFVCVCVRLATNGIRWMMYDFQIGFSLLTS